MEEIFFRGVNANNIERRYLNIGELRIEKKKKILKRRKRNGDNKEIKFSSYIKTFEAL